jgi:geranylgeranyl diphosphate synthase, type I
MDRPVLSTSVGDATEVRPAVDRALYDFLARQRRSAADARTGMLPLIEEIERTIRSGGKRLRPLFCYWGYRAGGAEDQRIMSAAASLELLHTFALVHDDVMDRSSIRRGEPSSYLRLARQVGVASSYADRFGTSAAILAGDLANVLADQLFLESPFPPDRMMAAGGILHAMRAEVIGGQYLDVLAAATGGASVSDARRIAFLKSGGYTVEKPLLIGATLAGAAGDVLAALSCYGVPLGEAFQLRDDVLGAFGDPAVTGKDGESDFREGKQTLLVALARERAASPDRRFLDERLGRHDLTPGDIERIRSLLGSTGALRETTETIAKLRNRALEALEDAALPDEPARALVELADVAAQRED